MVILAFTFCQSQNAVLQFSNSTSGTFSANDTQQDVVMIHDAGTTVSFTFAFPANPVNGQKVTMISRGGITSLSITAIVGSVYNSLTGMVAGSPASYMYYAPQTAWYRIR